MNGFEEPPLVACTEHTWGDGEIIREATCTEAGEKTYICAICGETRTEAIAELEHSWNDGEVTTAATCTEAGVKTYTCTVCSQTKTEAVPATGNHNYVSGVCSVCGARLSLKELYPEMTWAILEDIARQVSQDASIRAETTKTASDIVTSVTKTVGGKTYTISLGDWMPVDYTNGSSTITKKARIIGFKHDELASKAAYGGNDTYAGISFEFVNTLEPDSEMNSTGGNLEGWEGCELRKKLLPTNMKVKSTENTYGTGEYYAKLPTALTNEIKTVKKKWNPGGEAVLGKETEDKLWLLSYTEVCGSWMYVEVPDGVPYGFYIKNWSYSNVGKYAGASTSTHLNDWWLRTASTRQTSFINVQANGEVYDSYNHPTRGVAPGFSI